jgi:hypothetical protein
MILMPIGLQRRFLVGYYLPVVVLFYSGLSLIINQKIKSEKIIKRLLILLFIFSLPSTLIVYSGGIKAIIDKNDSLFMPKSIYSAGTWMDKNLDPGVVILSSPESGSIIPSILYSKVVCCHPFETVNYERTKTLVSAFWNNEMDLKSQRSTINKLKVDYIYYGFYEMKYQKPLILRELPIVYQTPDVVIYEVVR